MASIIVFANQKGGTGKTTSALNLGAALAELKKKILLVDFDPQGNATSGLGIKLKEGEGIYEILSGKKEIQKAILKISKNFYLLPSTSSLAGANIELVNLPRREFRLKEVLDLVKNNYDFVFIDTPPSLGILTINALVAADQIIIPVQCEYYALEGLGQLLSTIDLVKTNLKPNLKILGALITMFDKRTKLSKDVVLELRTKFPDKVFEVVIPRNIRLAEAPSFGQSVLQYNPGSSGAQAYRHLALEILK